MFLFTNQSPPHIKGSWKSQPTSKIKEDFIPLNKFCVEKISKHPPKFHGLYYYLWFPADTCYPWYMNQQSNPGMYQSTYYIKHSQLAIYICI
jgi:hypothetical protein